VRQKWILISVSAILVAYAVLSFVFFSIDCWIDRTSIDIGDGGRATLQRLAVDKSGSWLIVNLTFHPALKRNLTRTRLSVYSQGALVLELTHPFVIRQGIDYVEWSFSSGVRLAPINPGDNIKTVLELRSDDAILPSLRRSEISSFTLRATGKARS